MSFKIIVRDALLVAQGLAELPRLPPSAIKAAYWLGRIRDSLQDSIVRYNKEKDELIKQCGAFNPDTGTYIVGPDKIEEYNTGHDTLLDIEVEIPFDKVKLKDIMGTNPDKQPELSPDTMFKCYKVLDGEGI